jgi:Rho termination factor, N-terminal domain
MPGYPRHGRTTRRNHGPSIKGPEQYEALREEGASKEKAARISNESAREGRWNVGRRGGRNEDYDERTRNELRERARELGIESRSKMTKRQLIDALRNH